MNKNSFLNKVVEDITVFDVIEYFSEEQYETSTIEFKSGRVEYEKIYCEVSAFLNTNGGIIVIGAPEKQIINGKEVYKGDLTPSKIIKSGFILSQKLSSNIVPAAYSINIKELDYKDGKVFILDIPQSHYPPHQNSMDGKYYIRIETETTKAPHGLIQALFFKRQSSNIESELSLYTSDDFKKHILLTITNNSIMTALNGGYILEIFGVKSFRKVRKNKKVQRKNNINVFYNENDVGTNEDIYHFTYQDRFQTLHKGLFIIEDFIVELFDSNFILNVVAWAQDTEIKKYLWVIEPDNFEIMMKANENIDFYDDLFSKYNVKINFEKFAENGQKE